MISRPALFVDKDGTLVEDVPFNVDPAAVRLRAGAAAALRRLQRHGYAVVVVTNQPGLALGRFTLAALESLVAHLRGVLAAEGVALEGAYWCPHDPARGACPCRKPRAGLLRRAAAELALDLPRSWLIGDILDDVEAGARAGCRTVLLDVGGETEWRCGPLRTPDAIAPGWTQAADVIAAAARRAA